MQLQLVYLLYICSDNICIKHTFKFSKFLKFPRTTVIHKNNIYITRLVLFNDKASITWTKAMRSRDDVATL